jgi:type-F conjugative transfer system pilin assembly protein TrbC
VPARIDLRACWALACLLPCVALAQTPQWPTAQDIDRALKANPFPDADRIGAQPIPSRLAWIRNAARSTSKRWQGGKVHLPNAGTTSGAATVPLRIFITLDMPRASLQLLTDQAARAGAVLVLRGLKSQSMRQTVAVVQELIGKRRVAWVIDPEAFTRFAVRQAPTFVLTLNDAGNDAQAQLRHRMRNACQLRQCGRRCQPGLRAGNHPAPHAANGATCRASPQTLAGIASLMIVSRFLLCLITALAMHTWPAHADALSDAFNQGATLGRSGNAAGRGQISGTTAQATVPNYTTAPPEASYFGSPGLSTLSSAHVSACAGATGQTANFAQQGCNAVDFSQTNPSRRPSYTHRSERSRCGPVRRPSLRGSAEHCRKHRRHVQRLHC